MRPRSTSRGRDINTFLLLLLLPLLYIQGASPLDPSRLIALRALVIIHMLQAYMLQADTRSTPYSQPLCMQASAAA